MSFQPPYRPYQPGYPPAGNAAGLGGDQTFGIGGLRYRMEGDLEGGGAPVALDLGTAPLIDGPPAGRRVAKKAGAVNPVRQAGDQGAGGALPSCHQLLADWVVVLAATAVRSS